MARYYGRIGDAGTVIGISAEVRRSREGIAMVTRHGSLTQPSRGITGITLFYWDGEKGRVCAATIMGQAAYEAYMNDLRPAALDPEGRPPLLDHEAWGRIGQTTDDGEHIYGRMYLVRMSEAEASRLAGRISRDLHICS